MEINFVNIGFGNTINRNKVLCVLNPDTLPCKRLVTDSKNAFKMIDATCGRKTRAVIVLENGHIVLCGLQSETIMARLNLQTNANDKDDEE